MRRLVVALAMGMVWPLAAIAQQPAQTTPKKKSPTEIAATSRDLAEKNETCRRQAQEEKLAGLKRFRFIRDCRKPK